MTEPNDWPPTEYLESLPRKPPTDGRVLVHNQVRPRRVLNVGGFRAWLELPSELLEPCDCEWAPRFGTHYRVIAAHRPEQLSMIWVDRYPPVRELRILARDHNVSLPARADKRTILNTLFAAGVTVPRVPVTVRRPGT